MVEEVTVELETGSSENSGEAGALKLVEDHLKRGISNVRKSRDYYRRGSQLQTAALAILSATTTLLIAINQVYHRSVFATLSLVAGALMTVATAWTSWFGFRRLWLANTSTLNKLWALRDQIEYDKARHGNHLMALTVVDGYYEQLQQIFAEHNRTWQHVRSTEE
jgi:hypothetical protein